MSKKTKQGRIRHTCSAEVTEQVEKLIADLPRRRDLLIEYLHRLQDTLGYIGRDQMVALGRLLNIPVAEIYEVATFYHHFDVLKKEEAPPKHVTTVRVCTSVTCEMFAAAALIRKLKEHFGSTVRIKEAPCVGRCYAAPVAIAGTYPVEKANLEKIEQALDRNQTTDNPPLDVIGYQAYRKANGYQLLNACHRGEYTPDAVIQTLSDSGLRGLGGAGFPAGRKWSILKKSQKPTHIAINIDEGEPGTFKDKFYLERDPHRFIEGTLIAHWAIGADRIYIYLRDEYAACRAILEKELDLLQRDPPCPLPLIELRRGAGAYICGEESAMIESIEGKRGMPRLRPPYVAEVGLFGRPTLEQNMETLHWVRDIIEKGADWFSANGRRERKGLRSFSVSGRVKNPGVHQAPAGISAQELIDEYCDGMLDGHTLYGYLPGGASGGILPASMADLPLDFDTLQPHGCFIGSAAIIIFSEHDSAKQIALNTMRFFADESCGQCTPCRVGTVKAVELMEKSTWDAPLLLELASTMEDASICGLGQAAPNSLRCAMKYFPKEFETQ